MRFKAVPAPPSELADVSTVRDALPRVPRSETDCCARLARRVDWIDDRDAGREWLLFLRAASLATRTADGGYVRAASGGGAADSIRERGDADGESGDADVASATDLREAVAAGLRDHVLAASDVLDALDDEPRDVDAVFDAVRATIPEWERRRSDDWAAIWRERVDALLAWWALVGEARRTEAGYVRHTG